MAVVKSVDYNAQVKYFVDAKIRVGNVDFSKSEVRNIPSEALTVYRGWRDPGINLSLRRTINFKRIDGYLSYEPPINEVLTIKRLEEIVSSGDEELPVKSYYKTMDSDEVQQMCALVQATTGMPPTFRIVD